ncbi:hypothetical protein AQJ66_36545 [Streptomyces bungoensis]|uniref:Uncharacterized protein n=1 Tax=Streptomyces bungoensis TaxID=285568 RepID=A0A101SIR9_9ACTN|nr:hypothetical protein [Streptomyces bungoensis]KUN74994.1 hypothetical protein AQJ66_36545 [Streptomyces bungoensis]
MAGALGHGGIAAAARLGAGMGVLGEVTFAEDAGQVCHHRTPAVMSSLRDPARASLHRAG